MRSVSDSPARHAHVIAVVLAPLWPVGRHALIETGSLAQPVALFIPDADAAEREPLWRLLANRYLGEDETRPARNYAYVTGPLQLFADRPQLVLTALDQTSDAPATGGLRLA